MSSNKILGAPVYVQLDGSFQAPTASGDYVSGLINPDLRLPHLDAFIDQLNQALEGSPDTATNILDALPRVIADMRSKVKGSLTNARCKLVVGCKIDPANSMMEYSFEIQASGDKK